MVHDLASFGFSATVVPFEVGRVRPDRTMVRDQTTYHVEPTEARQDRVCDARTMVDRLASEVQSSCRLGRPVLTILDLCETCCRLLMNDLLRRRDQVRVERHAPLKVRVCDPCAEVRPVRDRHGCPVRETGHDQNHLAAAGRLVGDLPGHHDDPNLLVTTVDHPDDVGRPSLGLRDRVDPSRRVKMVDHPDVDHQLRGQDHVDLRLRLDVRRVERRTFSLLLWSASRFRRRRRL